MIETKIPEVVNHGKVVAVVDLFKILVSSLLNGNTKFLLTSRHAKEDKALFITCYCEPKDVGALLGRQESGFITPTKWAILRVLNIVAYHAGLNSVSIQIDDFTKMPAPEGE